MSRGKAIALAVLTIWPPIYIALFMATMLTMIFISNESINPEYIFKIIFPLHFLTMLEIIALTAIYIIFLFKTDRIEQAKKILWAVVLFFGNIIAMPIFWYLYIWKKPSANKLVST